jgi:hypothetical protein
MRPEDATSADKTTQNQNSEVGVILAGKTTWRGRHQRSEDGRVWTASQVPGTKEPEAPRCWLCDLSQETPPPPPLPQAVPNAGADGWGQTAARLRDGLGGRKVDMSIDTGVLWLPTAEERVGAFG